MIQSSQDALGMPLSLVMDFLLPEELADNDADEVLKTLMRMFDVS